MSGVAAVLRICGVKADERTGVAFKETVMKTMLVAVVIALVPVNLTGELSFIHAESSKSTIAAPAERPTICFEFAFWKYCI